MFVCVPPRMDLDFEPQAGAELIGNSKWGLLEDRPRLIDPGDPVEDRLRYDQNTVVVRRSERSGPRNTLVLWSRVRKGVSTVASALIAQGNGIMHGDFENA